MKVVHVDFNRERYIRFHQKQSTDRRHKRENFVTVIRNADLPLDIHRAAANEESASKARRQDLEQIRVFSAVFFACMLSVIGVLTLTAERGRSQSSDTFAQQAESHTTTSSGAYTGAQDLKTRRGVRSQGILDPRVEQILDSDFRTTLSRVAKWREQNRLLVMYRDQLAADSAFRSLGLGASPVHGSPPSADAQRE